MNNFVIRNLVLDKDLAFERPGRGGDQGHQAMTDIGVQSSGSVILSAALWLKVDSAKNLRFCES